MLSPDEIYDSINEELLDSFEEDKRIERKVVGIHARELGEYISMWANTVPDGGLTIVGMTDKGQVVGCHNVPQTKINELEKVPRRFCPDAKVESKRIEVTAPDGTPSFVILFRTRYREDKVVRDQSGNAYVRYGDEKHKLSDAEIRELEIDKRQVDIEKEPVSLRYPEDFDRELIRRFVDGVKKVHQPFQAYQDIEVLQQRRLGKVLAGRFQPNTACALAFANDPGQLFPGCEIRFLRVDGEFEQSGVNYNVTKTIPVEGPVPRLLEQTAAVLSAQLREFSAR